jgi:SAM-dependent methyltransferase
MGNEQQMENKLGEIAFRRQLFRQHVEGEQVFEDEYSAAEMLEILKARMGKTYCQMRELVARGVNISKYIEVGAERGQRSLVLENDLNAHGFAVDLSYDSLRAARYYAECFHKKKLPIRVCCDAYNLPFRNNSIPFVFCYNTLHHFPDPAPIVAEIHRVLAPGFFFFDEEPFKRLLHIGLYKRKPSRRIGAPRRNVLVKAFQALFSDVVSNEVEYGIIENEDISCSMWRRILSPFDKVEATLESPLGIHSSLYAPDLSVSHLLNKLMGGSIRALCEKASGQALQLENIWEALGCPNCRIRNIQGVEDRASLHLGDGVPRCTHCGCTFPVRDGVLFLFAETDLKRLYPDILKDYA